MQQPSREQLREAMRRFKANPMPHEEFARRAADAMVEDIRAGHDPWPGAKTVTVPEIQEDQSAREFTPEEEAARQAAKYLRENGQPDRELDAWIAEHVKGFKPRLIRDEQGIFCFEYTKHLDDGWQVLEEVRHWLCRERVLFTQHLYDIIKHRFPLAGEGHFISAEYAMLYITPDAICRAAYKTKTGQDWPGTPAAPPSAQETPNTQQ